MNVIIDKDVTAFDVAVHDVVLVEVVDRIGRLGELLNQGVYLVASASTIPTRTHKPDAVDSSMTTDIFAQGSVLHERAY